MTGNVFLILIIIVLLLLSKKFALYAAKTILRIISILSAIIVILKNKDLLYEIVYKFIPYLSCKIVYILNGILNYAVYYAEKVFGSLIK